MSDKFKQVFYFVLGAIVVALLVFLVNRLSNISLPEAQSDEKITELLDRIEADVSDSLAERSAQEEPTSDDDLNLDLKKSGPFMIPTSYTLDVMARNLQKPRVIVMDDKDNLIVSDSNAGTILQINQNKEIKSLLDSLDLPHGLALTQDHLYIAETGQVKRYMYNGESILDEGSLVTALPSGGRHWTRSIGFAPNDTSRLFISIGNSCNICEDDDEFRAQINVFNLIENTLSTYATGLRNAPYFTWNDQGELWTTEMGRDWLGDDLPPDEVNLVEQGKDYGYPYCYGKNITDPEYNNSDHCESTATESTIDLAAHVAPLGIDFLDNGDMILALHGSWNSSVPVGYKITRRTKESNYQESFDFMTGFLQADETIIGRPAGLLVDDKTGDIYLTDDKSGVIYVLRK